jgi:succinylarginine dihydrolase
MKAFEVNFDGLVGPTHNYAGLSYGNVASMGHKALTSNPRQAALQGLKKMKALSDLGLRQGVIAPQERPDLATLRKIGFSGSETEVLASALKQAPETLAACASAASMWVANAATVSPSADTKDGKVHFTPANLIDKFHRSIESPTTARVLKAMFGDSKHFVHHDPLPTGYAFGDEGAANHTRFCSEYGQAGLEFFVYGRVAFNTSAPRPQNFPARQTLEASLAVARRHELPAERVFFAQQNPFAIDTGAFHNDVVSVGNKNVFFFHEQAFANWALTTAELKKRFEAICKQELIIVKVSSDDVSLVDAVTSYLFNSQLVSLPSGGMCLIAPRECTEIASVKEYTDELIRGAGPIKEVLCFDLRQSMQNGGGPACLRLRVVLNELEFKAANQKVLLTDRLHKELVAWVDRHYRDRLSIQDLADPKLLVEVRTALDKLTQILGLGSVYPFQL